MEDNVSSEDDLSGKVKGKRPSQAEVNVPPVEAEGEKPSPLVLFACRHLWHKTCLEQASDAESEEGARQPGRLKCPVCI
jgi:hypothetical protein